MNEIKLVKAQGLQVAEAGSVIAGKIQEQAKSQVEPPAEDGPPPEETGK